MSKLTEEGFAELADDDKYDQYSDATDERDEIERQFEKLEQTNADMLAYIHEQHGGSAGDIYVKNCSHLSCVDLRRACGLPR